MRSTTISASVLAILACVAGCDASRSPATPAPAPAGASPAPASTAPLESTGPAAAPKVAPPGSTVAGAALPVPAMQKAPSGLEYAVLKEGAGAAPPVGAKVKVHWTGKLKDGKVFGDTRAAGVPDEFKLTRSDLIDGMFEALSTMKSGERRRLQVPSRLGYGPAGYRGVVPSNADLELDVELVSFAAAGAK